MGVNPGGRDARGCRVAYKSPTSAEEALDAPGCLLADRRQRDGTRSRAVGSR
jgi:hypothetical protein